MNNRADGINRTSPTSRFVALVTGAFLLLLNASPFQMRTALAAGAVEMQVERIITTAIDEYNGAMAAGDPSGWLKYFTDGVHRQGPQSTQDGKQAFSEYYQGQFKRFQARWTTRKIIVSGRSAAVVFEWDAVHKPSGTPLKVDMVAIFEMASSGKFESVSFFFDTAKLEKYFAAGGAQAE